MFGPILAMLIGLPACTHGVELSQEQWLNGSETTRAFLDSDQTLKRLTYEVLSESGRKMCLAALIEEEGYLVTKASELMVGEQEWLNVHRPASSAVIRPKSLFGEIRVRGLEKNDSYPARVLAIHLVDDLALLQTEGAPPIPAWAETATTTEGEWVASLNANHLVKIGVVGAPARPIERDGGTLGVLLEYIEGMEKGVSVAAVVDDSPADEVGIRPDDVILAVDGKAMNEIDVLREELTKRDPGEEVRLQIRRGTDQEAIDVTLGRPEVLHSGDDRNQRMSGPTSSRRAGFSRVIQHDTPLKPKGMGGPLVNLKGELVGINIARADRVTTYALPNAVVRQRVKELLALLRSPAQGTAPSFVSR